MTERGDDGRSPFLNERGVIRTILLPQEIDALDDAVLAERETFDAVITRRAKRPAAAVAVYRRGIV